jgi:hypothetical protein
MHIPIDGSSLNNFQETEASSFEENEVMTKAPNYSHVSFASNKLILQQLMVSWR